MESMEWIFPKAWVFDGKKCQKSTERHFKLGHSRGLIVDATLEASGAPIHELNGALGLDRGNCRIHVLRHHITWLYQFPSCHTRHVRKTLKESGFRNTKQISQYIYIVINNGNNIYITLYNKYLIISAHHTQIRSLLSQKGLHFFAEAPRYIMQQAMYLPWRGSHFTFGLRILWNIKKTKDDESI